MMWWCARQCAKQCAEQCAEQCAKQDVMSWCVNMIKVNIDCQYAGNVQAGAKHVLSAWTGSRGKAGRLLMCRVEYRVSLCRKMMTVFSK